MQLAPAFGRSEFLSRAAGILLGVLLLVLFGLGGPSGALGLAALAFAGVGALLLVPSPPIEVVLPASGALLLVPQFSAGIHVFDVVQPGIGWTRLHTSDDRGRPRIID